MKPFASAADDALFEATDGRVFQVHLMLSRRLEQPPLPRPASGRTERERARWVLRPANEEYCTLSIMISLNRTAEVKFPVSPFIVHNPRRLYFRMADHRVQLAIRRLAAKHAV